MAEDMIEIDEPDEGQVLLVRLTIEQAKTMLLQLLKHEADASRRQEFDEIFQLLLKVTERLNALALDEPGRAH